jgi:hypothetical protein
MLLRPPRAPRLEEQRLHSRARRGRQAEGGHTVKGSRGASDIAGQAGWRAAALVLAVICWSGGLPTSWAQAPLTTAMARFDEGDFLAAREVLDALGPAEGQERVARLVLRARIAAALGDAAEMTRAVRAVAALDPSASFDASVVPEVREAFAAARDALRDTRLRVDARRDADAVRVEARLLDPHALAPRVRVWARAGSSDWRSGETSLVLENAADASVLYYAEAVGGAGSGAEEVVFVSDGSRDDPRVLDAGVVARGDVDAAFDPAAEAPAAAVEATPWAWIGVGTGVGVAVAVGAVVLAVVLQPSPDTVLGAPSFPTIAPWTP